MITKKNFRYAEDLKRFAIFLLKEYCYEMSLLHTSESSKKSSRLCKKGFFNISHPDLTTKVK